MSGEAVSVQQDCYSFTQHILKQNNFICVRYWLNELTGTNIEEFGRFTIQSRLASCAGRLGFANVNQFVEFLAEQTNDFTQPCWQQLLDAALETDSWFRREARHFNFLRQIVLPELTDTCRVLSAGCGAGEEAFDIAFECIQYFGLEAGWQVEGIDIRAEAIRFAKTGRWETEDCGPVSDDNLAKFFEPCQQGLRIKSSIREKVNFRCQNLLQAKNDEQYHVVFCRNLLVDMEKRSAQTLIDNMMACLKPGGYLLVSHSEKLADFINNAYLLSPHIARKA